MHWYLSLDNICSSLKVFLEIRSGEIVRILEHTMLAENIRAYFRAK